MEAIDLYDWRNPAKFDGINLYKKIVNQLSKQRIDDIRLKEGDDILVATYPRTGTTWMSQILCLMLAKEETYHETKKISYSDRVLFLEYFWPGSDRWQISRLDTVPTPRVDKTHLPYRFIPRWINEDKVKTILTTRNPKDTLVSLFHFYNDMELQNFSGTWTEFFDHVKGGNVVYGDQYEWLKDWSNNKDKGQLLFIKFEDLKRDTKAYIEKIAAFLNITISASRMENVLRDTGVTQMQADMAGMVGGLKAGGSFVRKGTSGGWKKYFTVEQNEWFDSKYKKLYEELDIDVHYE